MTNKNYTEIPWLTVFIILKFNVIKAIAHYRDSSGSEPARVDILNPDLTLFSSASGRHLNDALRGTAGIDGIRLYDYESGDARTEKLAQRMRAIAPDHPQFEVLRTQARKIGAKFCHFRAGTYHDCFYEPGFERLQTMGYDVKKVF